MTGWKTKTGAILSIVGTLWGMYNSIISVPEGLQAIGVAIAALGIGHKIDKTNKHT